MLLPGETLIDGVVEDVSFSFSLEILDGHDDAPVVPEVAVVVALQDLVPADPRVSREKHVGLVLQPLADTGGGEDDAWRGCGGEDGDGSGAGILPRQLLGDVEVTVIIL